MHYTNFKNVMFRVDSSSDIGLGHLMRSLVLADKFHNSNICFASQNLKGNANYKVTQNSFSLVELKDFSPEILALHVERLKIDLLVIDSYKIDKDYEQKIREKTGVTLMVIDDIYEEHICDMLLNINIYADAKKYNGLIPTTCRVFCGKNEQLIRDEFRKTYPIKNKRDKFSVYIAMGGSDAMGLNLPILKALKKVKNIHIELVTTTSNQALKELQKYVRWHKNITLHVDASNIAKVLSCVDVAIITPSLSASEVSCMRVPFIAIKSASNQKLMYESLKKQHIPVLDKFSEKRLHVELLQSKKKLELYKFRLRKMQYES